MKKDLLKISSVILMFVISSAAFAVTSPTEDIMKIGAGARPMGMGKAFVAVADDINSIFLNPAGLGQVRTFEVTSMYSSMFEGELPYFLLAAAFPMKYGTLATGYINTQISQIPSPTPTTIGYFDYYDSLYFLSYGADASSLFRGRKVLIGGNIKYFNKGFTGSFTNVGRGLDIDLGIKYMPIQSFAVGLTLQNAYPAKVQWTTGSQDEIPMVAKIGIASKALKDRLLLALDLDTSPGRNLPSTIHFGAEWALFSNFKIRCGLDQTASVSNMVSTNATAGVGINIRGFQIDYAYHPYKDTANNATHYISLSYIGPLPDPNKKKILPAGTSKEAVVVSGKKISDIPSDYWAINAINYVINSKLLNLYPDGMFRPEKPITRADLAVMIVKAKFSGYPPAGTKEFSFKDVPGNYWAKKMIGVAASQDLMRGYPDDTFKPNDKVSLLDAAYAFTKLGNLSAKVTGPVYSNIPANHIAAGMIKSAKDKGMLDFVSGPDFAINAPVTRAQAAWMLFKLKK